MIATAFYYLGSAHRTSDLEIPAIVVQPPTPVPSEAGGSPALSFNSVDLAALDLADGDEQDARRRSTESLALAPFVSIITLMRRAVRRHSRSEAAGSRGMQERKEPTITITGPDGGASEQKPTRRQRSASFAPRAHHTVADDFNDEFLSPSFARVPRKRMIDPSPFLETEHYEYAEVSSPASRAHDVSETIVSWS
ncbi:hypothetical protein PsYK624_053850 [Phanerochaete sordida]|uniref:Uncharacterized protein n=1 Tax=Phanerochaete sordida TaxID=48140 RepID=A0A9P3G6P8_9APHY|nr:hypothetical protein PsYK624_053850 [Phanerochaete sordida]